MKTRTVAAIMAQLTSYLLGISIMLCGVNLYAELGLPEPDAYNFGPEGRTVQDLQDYGKPAQMENFLPNQPIAAHEADGSRVYVSPDGKMTVSIAANGTMQFTLGGITKTYDADGNLTQTSTLVKGTNMVKITNGQGTVTGYEELGYGGKVVKQYDAQSNLIETYQYSAYGKSIEYVLNELSLTKTVYNSAGVPACDVDFTGATVATYHYDNAKRLQSKTDQYGNTTNFDIYGNMTYTQDCNSQKICQYYYKTDADGRYILDKMENLSPTSQSSGDAYQGDVTYFKDGLAVQTVSSLGAVVKEYTYSGNQLLYTFDSRNNETTWYDTNGNQLCSTLNGAMEQEWMYYKSRLVGYYDDTTKTVTLYQNERQDQNVQLYQQENAPTADQIENYYTNQGLMADVGYSQQDSALTANWKGLPKDQRQVGNQNMTFNIMQSADFDVIAQNTGLLQSKLNYSNGKLQSVVSRNNNDGTGWVTTIYVGEGSQSNMTNFTVSGDQSANASQAEQLLSAVVENNQSISDISSGSGALADFAKSVKSMGISPESISRLSDAQICTLFGWTLNATNTQACIADVRARANNAGPLGSVYVTYSFDQSGLGTKIYAAGVTAADSNSMTVGGTYVNKMLDLTTEQARESVTLVNAQPFDINSAPDNAPVTPNYSLLNPGNITPAQITTVNGVVTAYAANGIKLYQIDNLTGQQTVFDSFGRQSAVYNYAGVLQTSYQYSPVDGALQSEKSYDNQINSYVTTFFIGWGPVSGANKTSVTVLGDQTANLQQINQVFSAILNGTVDSLSSSLASFANSLVSTIRNITVSPANILKMSDTQLANLLGWDMSAANTAQYISDVRYRATNAGLEGSVSINYGTTNNRLYATQVSAVNQSNVPITGLNGYETIDVSTLQLFNGVVAGAANSAAQMTGLYLFSSLANLASSLQ